MMLAAVLTAPSAMELRERGIPAVGPEDCLVRIDRVGLCGSDVSYYRKAANGDFAVRAPLVLGHEIVGTIEAAGDAVRAECAPGVAVAVYPMWPSPLPGGDGSLVPVAEGSSSFLGSASTWPHTDGGLQEFLVLRHERLRPLPAGLPLDRAVLAEPLSVVLHALSRLTAPVAGRRVLVCGSGPIGLLAMMALRHRGAASVAMTDLSPLALELAARLGADATIRIPDEAPEHDGYDLVVEASGSPVSFQASLAACRPAGTVLQLGMLPAAASPVQLSAIVTKELQVLGTHRFGDELDTALTMLAELPEADALLAESFPLAEAGRAIEAAGDAAVVGKVTVSPSGR